MASYFNSFAQQDDIGVSYNNSSASQDDMCDVSYIDGIGCRIPVAINVQRGSQPIDTTYLMYSSITPVYSHAMINLSNPSPSKVKTAYDLQMRYIRAVCKGTRFHCNHCNTMNKKVFNAIACRFCELQINKAASVEFDFSSNISDEDKARLFGSVANYEDCLTNYTEKRVPPKRCDMCSNITRGQWAACKPCGSLNISPMTEIMTMIAPGLYLTGDKCDYIKYRDDIIAATGQDPAVVQVLTIGKSDVNTVIVPGATNMRVSINDDPDAAFQLSMQLPEIIQFIAKGTTIVHCKAGASRSASVVVAFLMFMSGGAYASVSDAFAYVYEKRPILNINTGFIDMLKRIETPMRLRNTYMYENLWAHSYVLTTSEYEFEELFQRNTTFETALIKLNAKKLETFRAIKIAKMAKEEKEATHA